MVFSDYCSFLIREIEYLKSQDYQKLKGVISAYTDTFYTIFSDVVEKNVLIFIYHRSNNVLKNKNSTH